MSRGATVAVALLLASALVSGCGVQQDGEPRALAPEGVPFDLLAPSTTTSTTTPPGPTVTTTVYFAGTEDRLLPVERDVTAPADVRSVLQALLAGATQDERDRGVRSLIPRGTELLGVEGPEDGLVTVDLSEDLSTAIAGAGLRLALAQLVWTLTDSTRIDRVLFEFDGQQREVPRGDGSQTAEPLTRRDFAQFDPSPPPTLPPPTPEPEPAPGG